MNDLLSLFEKHTDTLIERTKTKPQKTSEFKLNKQTITFALDPPLYQGDPTVPQTNLIGFQQKRISSHDIPSSKHLRRTIVFPFL